METVPFVAEDPLLPGLRKSNSLYQSAHDEILRERRRVNEDEQSKFRSHPVRPSSALSEATTFLQSHSDRAFPQSRNLSQQWLDHGEWEAREYTSTDQYFGPSIYRDLKRTPPTPRSQPVTHRHSNSWEGEFVPRRTLTPPRHLPNYHGPFRNNKPINQNFAPQEVRGLASFSQTLGTPPKSALRQLGSYSKLQPQRPFSPPNVPAFRQQEESRPVTSMAEIPMTRMTRLKEPARTFSKDEDSHSDAGVGLGSISGMAASRSVSIRRIKSDIDITRSQPPSTPSIPEITAARMVPFLERYSLIKKLKNRIPKEDKENMSPRPVHLIPGIVSPSTPPHVIKIGKPNGRYKTSTMPVYHLTTPDSDSEGTSAPVEAKELLPAIDYVPTSAQPLHEITIDRVSHTDKWLEEIVKLTLTPEPKSEITTAPDQPRNTIDIKRHRVFSTRVEVRPRDKLSPPKEDKLKKVRCRDGQGDQQDRPTSWIASELFSIANITAASLKLDVECPPKEERGSEAKKAECEEVVNVQVDGLRDEDYREIESLIGDYFEDVKIVGSDCSEDVSL